MRLMLNLKSGGREVSVDLKKIEIRDGYLVTDRGKTALDRIDTALVKP